MVMLKHFIHRHRHDCVDDKFFNVVFKLLQPLARIPQVLKLYKNLVARLNHLSRLRKSKLESGTYKLCKLQLLSLEVDHCGFVYVLKCFTDFYAFDSLLWPHH